MYEEQTPEKLKADILEKITLLDTREGSFADDMAGPIAVELFKLYGSLNAARYIAWPDETSGEYLDLAAEDLGMKPRKAGMCAEGTLSITGRAGYLLTEGMGFRTADDLIFRVLYATVIPESGTAQVLVRADAAGVKYNISSGTILYSCAGDSRITAVTASTAAIGGTEIESDADLYARITAARRKPSTSGNVYDYEKWALEVAGVGAAKVTPIWTGAGTVKVLIADGERQPVDARIVAACAAHIETVRPVGAKVTVKSASALPIAVAVTVTIDTSTTKEAVRTAFFTALDGYLRSLAFVQYEVLLNRVGALLMGLDGVTDYSALTLNGTAASITVGTEEVPVIGAVRFT